MTDAWVAVNMFTGEMRGLDEIESKPKHARKPDVVFVAGVKLWGYDGQPLTNSLRGACNKARSEIVKYEREVDTEVTLDEIAELIAGFKAWFVEYRRERFNENCRRCPYPMETAKLWPEYRKPQESVAESWRAIVDTQMANPNSAAYRLAHRSETEGASDE